MTTLYAKYWRCSSVSGCPDVMICTTLHSPPTRALNRCVRANFQASVQEQNTHAPFIRQRQSLRDRMGRAHKLQVRIHHLCHHVAVAGEEHATLYRTHMPRVSICTAKERMRGELQKNAHFKSRRMAVHACRYRLPCSQERGQTVGRTRSRRTRPPRGAKDCVIGRGCCASDPSSTAPEDHSLTSAAGAEEPRGGGRRVLLV